MKNSSKILYNKVLKINLNQIKHLWQEKRPKIELNYQKLKKTLQNLSTSEKNIIEKQKSKTLNMEKFVLQHN